jgi:Mg2+/Co2+ transporter CorB
MVVVAIALGLAILFSAFFSAVELAVFFPGESRVRAMAEQQVAGANALAQLRANPERTLVFLRLGDALCDVSAGALTAYIAFLEWQIIGLAIGIGVVTLVVLYLGELLPIGIAANHGLRIALALAPTLLVITRVLGPLLIFVARLSSIRPERR